MGAYITGTDIAAFLGDLAYLRAFDKDNDGTADTAIVNGAIGLVEALVNAKLRASHNTPFTGTIPDHIKHISVMMACHAAVMFYPGNSGGGSGQNAGQLQSPYRGLWTEAMAMLSDLAKDREARLPESTPLPEPTLTLTTLSGVVAAQEPFFPDPNDRCGGSGF